MCEKAPAEGRGCFDKRAKGPWSPATFGDVTIVPDAQVEAVIAPYRVEVDGKVEAGVVDALRRGVILEDSRSCKAILEDVEEEATFGEQDLRAAPSSKSGRVVEFEAAPSRKSDTSNSSWVVPEDPEKWRSEIFGSEPDRNSIFGSDPDPDPVEVVSDSPPEGKEKQKGKQKRVPAPSETLGENS